MSGTTKIILILVALYVLGAIVTALYIANTADDRIAAGKPVFGGSSGASPALQLIETTVGWPYAIAKSVGG